MHDSHRRRIIDLSHCVGASTPPFPGDPPVEVRVLCSAAEPSKPGAPRINATWLGASLHLGTHMDAPLHFFKGSTAIDEVSLDTCMGPAVLIRIQPGSRGGEITAQDLVPFGAEIRRTRRVVLDTGWHHEWLKDGYFTDHPVLTGEAARFLVGCGVKLIGVDMPSVDRAPHDAHVEILGNGVLIVENLARLDEVPQGVFELACFPLLLSGLDGSPVRAVAWVS